MEHSHYRVYYAINNEEKLSVLPWSDLQNILFSENSKVQKSIYAFSLLIKERVGGVDLNIYIHTCTHIHTQAHIHTYTMNISMNIFSYT